MQVIFETVCWIHLVGGMQSDLFSKKFFKLNRNCRLWRH